MWNVQQWEFYSFWRSFRGKNFIVKFVFGPPPVSGRIMVMVVHFVIIVCFIIIIVIFRYYIFSMHAVIQYIQ